MASLENFSILCAIFLIFVSVHMTLAAEETDSYTQWQKSNGAPVPKSNTVGYGVYLGARNRRFFGPNSNNQIDFPLYLSDDLGHAVRGDSELLKWNGDLNGFDDEYDVAEGYERLYDLKRPYYGYPRRSRAGRALLTGDSQEAIKRGGPGGPGMWFGPRLGRVQKRSPTKEDV